MSHRIVFSLLLLLASSGCATIFRQATQMEAGVDGAACVGSIGSAPAALIPATNSSLLGQAQLPTDQGGTCIAQVFSVTSPLVLYRVFDSSNPYSKFGRWWALSRPAGPKDSYRSAFAICPEWSNLDKLVSCEVLPGTQVVIGTTQSAVCANGSTLPKTPEIQVFVPNNGKHGIYHVGACTEESPWP
jgi:hypothetical protein